MRTLLVKKARSLAKVILVLALSACVSEPPKLVIPEPKPEPHGPVIIPPAPGETPGAISDKWNGGRFAILDSQGVDDKGANNQLWDFATAGSKVLVASYLGSGVMGLTQFAITGQYEGMVRHAMGGSSVPRKVAIHAGAGGAISSIAAVGYHTPVAGSPFKGFIARFGADGKADANFVASRNAQAVMNYQDTVVARHYDDGRLLFMSNRRTAQTGGTTVYDTVLSVSKADGSRDSVVSSCVAPAAGTPARTQFDTDRLKYCGYVTFDASQSGNKAQMMQAMILDASKRILVAGYALGADGRSHVYVERRTAGGLRDDSFLGLRPGDVNAPKPFNGIALDDFATDLAIVDNRILVTGYLSQGGRKRPFVLALNASDGKLDSNFSGGPAAFGEDVRHGMVILGDGEMDITPNAIILQSHRNKAILVGTRKTSDTTTELYLGVFSTIDGTEEAELPEPSLPQGITKVEGLRGLVAADGSPLIGVRLISPDGSNPDRNVTGIAKLNKL